jgi:hypothetical protein
MRGQPGTTLANTGISSSHPANAVTHIRVMANSPARENFLKVAMRAIMRF